MGKGWDWIVCDGWLINALSLHTAMYLQVGKVGMFIQYGVRRYIRRYGHVLTDRVTTSTYLTYTYLSLPLLSFCRRRLG